MLKHTPSTAVCDVVTLIQGTEAWHDYRNLRITATDASVYVQKEVINEVKLDAAKQGKILEVDLLESLGITAKHVFDTTLYQTILRKRKIYPAIETNEAMLWGQKFEPKMLAYLESLWGMTLIPGEVVQSTVHTPFMASLDGRLPPDFKAILEIKVPYSTGDFSPVRIKFAYMRKLVANLTMAVKGLAAAQLVVHLAPVLSTLREEVAGFKNDFTTGVLIKNSPIGEFNASVLGVSPEFTVEHLIQMWEDILKDSPENEIAEVHEAVRKGLGLKVFPASVDQLILVLKEKLATLRFICLAETQHLKLEIGQGVIHKPNYWVQMAFQMLVTGAQEAWFCVGATKGEEIDPRFCIVEKITRPSDAFYAQLIAYLSYIYEEYYLNGMDPPMLAEDIKIEAALNAKLSQGELFTEDPLDFVNTYKQQLADKERISKEIAESEEKLKSWHQLNGDGVFGEGISISSKRSTTVSYVKILKDPELTNSIAKDILEALAKKHTKETLSVSIKVI